MSGLFNTISNFFSYQEPKVEEKGFELLESEKEGTDYTGKPQPGKESTTEEEKPTGYTPRHRRSRRYKHTEGINGQRKGVQPVPIEKWVEDAVKPEKQNPSDTISPILSVNMEVLKQKFIMPKNQDIVIRELNVGRKKKAFLFYIIGMVDKQILNLGILPQLMAKDVFEECVEQEAVDHIIKNVLTVHQAEKTKSYQHIVMQILNGSSALFMDGCSECILIEARGFEKRNVDQPITEMVVKGSHEAFTENIHTNISLIRRAIKNPNLVTELLTIGSTNHANYAVVYMEGIANPKVVAEVHKRLNKISTNYILGDGLVESFIEDNPFMLFPQVLSTERVDRTASFLMEGQVAIIVDGAPFALAVPVTFIRLFHTSEDYFLRWPFGTFLRLIRMFGLFCATLLPGLYLSLVLFHVEAIPSELLISIAQARELVPFPAVLEVLIMEVSFELIREGGIRVPSVIGQTLGIVGALILGQAAVAAGVVSPILVIVVSITALGSFVIPNYSLALSIRIERFLFIIAGATLGFYGISLMLVFLAYAACSMKSFGVPFFSPIAPRTKMNQDLIIRKPVWMQNKRSDDLNSPNRKKQGYNPKSWLAEDEQDMKKEIKDDQGR